jgi:hypothetical protein
MVLLLLPCGMESNLMVIRASRSRGWLNGKCKTSSIIARMYVLYVISTWPRAAAAVDRTFLFSHLLSSVNVLRVRIYVLRTL